jgi:hypothetical protein
MPLGLVPAAAIEVAGRPAVTHGVLVTLDATRRVGDLKDIEDAYTQTSGRRPC